MRKRSAAVFTALTMLICICPASFASVTRMDKVSVSPQGALRKTPDAYMFSIEGNEEKYIMLDHDTDGFYIVSHKNLGRFQYDPDNSAKFDPDDENSIAHILNTVYLTDGYNGKILPRQILSHLKEHEWQTEAGVAGSSFEEDYTVKCKIALMSATEWLKYYTMFGAYDDESWWGWYLRTSFAGTALATEHDVLAVSGQNTAGPIVISCPAQTACGVRPVFYLDDDFFLSVRCNVATLGYRVKRKLTETFTDAQLLGIYSPEEVKQLHADIPPQAKDVWAIGYRNVGDTLTGYYKFYHEEGKTESGTRVRWVKSKTLDGVKTYIPGTDGCFTYELKESDAGYFVYFEVTPATASAVGEPAYSFAISGSEVMAAYKPEVKKVHLFGEAYVGNEIGVDYIYTDKNRELEEGTTFQWQRNTPSGFVDIPGAVDKYYVITQDDAGAQIRVGITPQNRGRYRLAPPYNKGVASVGDTYYSETVVPTQYRSLTDLQKQEEAFVKTLAKAGEGAYAAAGCSLSVNRAQAVSINVNGLKNAYSVSFILRAGTGAVPSLTSKNYDAYITGDGPYKCVLTKKGYVFAEDVSGELAIVGFASPYTGDISVEELTAAGFVEGEICEYSGAPAAVSLTVSSTGTGSAFSGLENISDYRGSTSYLNDQPEGLLQKLVGYSGGTVDGVAYPGAASNTRLSMPGFYGGVRSWNFPQSDTTSEINFYKVRGVDGAWAYEFENPTKYDVVRNISQKTLTPYNTNKGSDIVVKYSICPKTRGRYAVTFDILCYRTDRNLDNQIIYPDYATGRATPNLVFESDAEGNKIYFGAREYQWGAGRGAQIGTWEPGVQYNIVLAVKDINSGSDAFYIRGLWINGKKAVLEDKGIATVSGDYLRLNNATNSQAIYNTVTPSSISGDALRNEHKGWAWNSLGFSAASYDGTVPGIVDYSNIGIYTADGFDMPETGSFVFYNASKTERVNSVESAGGSVTVTRKMNTGGAKVMAVAAVYDAKTDRFLGARCASGTENIEIPVSAADYGGGEIYIKALFFYADDMFKPYESVTLLPWSA